ncbi:hypothetical protein [Bradyrhizobium elkanii]|uniref:hypothetical protein n=1 Tax=Bradyrhizobium elkanii TaxID=29448 RepID=UPI003518FB25
MRQKNQVELNLSPGAEGEARSAGAREPEARAAEVCLERPAVAGPSMEDVVESENLKAALAQVKRNKGAAGVDGMTVGELSAHLKEHWPAIRAQLLDGTYKPQPVRRVEIPKASGGLRPARSTRDPRRLVIAAGWLCKWFFRQEESLACQADTLPITR